ncbi:MAG: outer membrane beta-barrel protein [Candidatus Dadabacteria bacterium]
MLRKAIVFGTALAALHNASGQDSTKTSPLTINGSADAYYKYDFGESKTNNFTSFTNSHNTFELGMASVKLDYKTPKVEMVADLGFGKRATEFSYNDQGILAGVKQLYMSWSVNDWLKLTAGSWATHIGYELVDAYANRNYSMSYMFTNGPFFHTGVKAEATFNKSGFMIGMANPTDFKYVPDGIINKKFVIAQYSFVPGDLFKVYLNYAGGQNVDTTKSKQFDVVITSKLADNFSLGYNGTLFNTSKYLGNKSFNDYKTCWGSALYLNFDASSHLGFTLREEYFSDHNKLKIYSQQLDGGYVVGSTLSANYKVDNLTIIPEFRMDYSSNPLFVKKDGSATKNAANVLLAAIYSF